MVSNFPEIRLFHLVCVNKGFAKCDTNTNTLILCITKIHNQFDSKLPIGYPGTSIVSGCGSLTENILAYVDSMLKRRMEFHGIKIKYDFL